MVMGGRSTAAIGVLGNWLPTDLPSRLVGSVPPVADLVLDILHTACLPATYRTRCSPGREHGMQIHTGPITLPTYSSLSTPTSLHPTHPSIPSYAHTLSPPPTAHTSPHPVPTCQAQGALFQTCTGSRAGVRRRHWRVPAAELPNNRGLHGAMVTVVWTPSADYSLTACDGRADLRPPAAVIGPSGRARPVPCSPAYNVISRAQQPRRSARQRLSASDSPHTSFCLFEQAALHSGLHSDTPRLRCAAPGHTRACEASPLALP